jgi:hypothetical protein
MIKIIFIYFLYLNCFIVGYRLFRYITTPLAKKIGLYKYYSKLFFTVPIWFNLKELHIGTTWDFFRLKSISQAKLLYFLCEGLINLCTAIEKGEESMNMHFKATMYYFKDTTTEKYGFKTRKLNIIELFLFTLNYLELCLLYSISTRRVQFIPLKNLKMLDCTGYELVANKSKYKAYYEKLKIKLASDADINYIRAA